MEKPRAIICDLDGTLYDSRERQARCFPPGEKRDFDRWNREALTDAPNLWCAELVHAMRSIGAFPIFVSGRDAAYENDTALWLKEFLNLNREDYLLYMRPTGDYRRDTDLKQQIYEQQIRDNWDVRFCIDDRRCVVDRWREMGLVCLQCAEGNY